MYPEEYRPKLKLEDTPRMKLFKRLNMVLLILILMATVIYLPISPDLVPIHYDAEGNVDRMGSKYEMLIFTVISVLLYFSFNWLIKRPWIFNYIQELTKDNVRQQYQIGRMILLVTLFGSLLLMLMILTHIILGITTLGWMFYIVSGGFIAIVVWSVYIGVKG